MNAGQYLEYLSERQALLKKQLACAKDEWRSLQSDQQATVKGCRVTQLIDDIKTALHLVSTEISRLANPEPVCRRCGVKLVEEREQVTLITQYCDKCSN
ncbi:hypothetical protein QTP81_11745 [Alteromonas sp. ASW11-36]|uniref:DksA C4-type domain-containing protein n=1 Tax=Alteromonas arenosi TaxID=3055817 RepID=A0ABT7SYJ4_9ALTE|nr:hypothetical protein [Alteromonas sp. ASW11-36]MDM7861268.1 hypothetical protein [Alteromonas sp. ASW11-36]